MQNQEKKTIFILSLTSDIGIALATRYLKEGHQVIGTYRTEKHLELLKEISKECKLYHCNIDDKSSVEDLIHEYKKLNMGWDILISCPCTPLPLGPFFECNFDEWSNSIHTNAIEQLRVLHALYPLRNKRGLCDVAFFAGGGTNNAVLNFSAYTVSKIMLIKMSELIDAENKDLNVFIVGPGWTKTKTHYITLNHVDKTDKKYSETIEFMKNGEGTSMDDIYNCISWLCNQGKQVAGGRNFSIVHDKWKKNGREELVSELIRDNNMYKLRRWKNNFLTKNK